MCETSSLTPDAIVVELACGLETRIFRLDLPTRANCCCIDTPAVIELRRRLVPTHERETRIGASLEGSSWLDAVPTHWPTTIVADAVLSFFTPAEAIGLLNLLTQHFEHGELVFQANGTYPTRDLGRVPELKMKGSWSPYRGFGVLKISADSLSSSEPYCVC